MITIELVHEYGEKTEKPQYRSHSPAIAPGVLDPIYNVALGRQDTLIRAAHQARLARAAVKKQTARQAEQVPVDVQRYGENPAATRTIFERYTRRLAGLVNRS